MQSMVDNNLTFGPDITWPKDFPELKLIDESLRCGICYDYLKTVMVTPCAHSYCSICIRKYLSYKTACPICFEEVFETNLRNNRILDRLVDIFSQIRDKLIKHLKIAAIHFNCNEKSASPFTPSSKSTSQKPSLPSETPKNTSKKLVTKVASSKGKLNFSSSSSPSTSVNKSEISKRLEDILGSPSSSCTNTLDPGHPVCEDPEVNVATVPSMFLKDPQPSQTQARSDVPLVSCPVCFVDIPERNINTHLDNCLANADKPVKSPVKKKLKRNPLPKMVWHMMAEKDLRKKLKDYGLNTQGEKRTLISRIQRYIVLYNSECDSENPRSVADIIRQVEREEKQLPAVTQQRLVVHKKTDPKVIEEENQKYIQENKNSFKKLIEAMREREGRNIKPLRPVNRLSSDDDDGDDQKKGKENKESQQEKISETINLCESRSSSPVLGSWVTGDKSKVSEFPSNNSDENTLEEPSSLDIFEPEISCIVDTPEKNNVVCNGIEGSVSKSGIHSDIDADGLFHSSPSRPPLSPSCIIRAHSDSDSEDSISILVNQNVDDRLEDNSYEVEATEAVDAGTSQLGDPDFVLDTEDQEQGESEEVFVPKRKSKRKHEKASVNEIPSPRRTRRRLNKH